VIASDLARRQAAILVELAAIAYGRAMRKVKP